MNYNPTTRIPYKGRRKFSKYANAPKTRSVRKKWIIRDKRRGTLGAQQFAKRKKR